ncbi:MAG TPA: hypothetical protein VLD67_15510 [Vicinamibacterales bacterium]|nr:hypothetical protein [Vicinamibacterales bacterium]
MDERAVRVLVREALAKRLGDVRPRDAGTPLKFAAQHVSHYRYVLPKSEGPCLIEPSVQCTHCGYCESHGH